MTFKELLEKITGGHFCCNSGCCGKFYARPHCSTEEPDFDLVLVIRLIVACVTFAAALLIKKIPDSAVTIMLIISALVSGYDIIAGAILSVMGGSYFDKSLLIVLSATLGFIFGAKIESAALVLLFQLGGVFVDYAVMRTRLSVLDAVSCDSEDARVVRDTWEEELDSDAVEIGDHIIVNPGERVPCDCIVISGTSSLDLSALGDTAGQILAKEGDEILSGSLNQGGTLRCEVTAKREDSTAAALTNAVENGSNRGQVVPPMLSKFLSLYTPVLVVLAVVAACLLPLALKITFAEAVSRALVFLIIANPCALVISIPLIRLSAMGGAAKCGIIFDGCNAMDALSQSSIVAFDKAGTLTEGRPRVVSIKSTRMKPEVLLKIAAHALAYSNSAEARSIIASYASTIYIDLVENFVDIPGHGSEVFVDNVRICVGTRDLMTIKSISVPDEDISDDFSVYVSIGDDYAGRIILSDSVRSDAASGISDLADKGVEQVVMYSPDSRDVAARMASTLGIYEYYSEQDKNDLRNALQELHEGAAPGSTLALVEGADAAGGAHSAADVDILMTGVDALTMPTGADVSIFGGKVERVPLAIGISKYANMLIWAVASAVLLVKVVLLVLAIFGFATMWFAAFIDACAAVAAVLVSILAFTGELSGKRKIRE